MTPSQRHQILTRIFVEIYDLEDEERRKALDRLCRSHPTLRGDLDLLLSIHDSATASRTGIPGKRPIDAPSEAWPRVFRGRRRHPPPARPSI